MRVNDVAAAILSLSSAILTVSCLQSPTALPEAGGKGESAPTIEVKDDGDPFGGDPDLGGIGSEPPASGVGSDPGSSGFGSGVGSGSGRSAGGDLEVGAGQGNPTLLAQCLALAPASVPTKEAFCRTLPDSGMRGRCWMYRWNRYEWTGWCYAEFSD
jgi:hypothetical protein